MSSFPLPYAMLTTPQPHMHHPGSSIQMYPLPQPTMGNTNIVIQYPAISDWLAQLDANPI
jgi:hypothetical protein